MQRILRLAREAISDINYIDIDTFLLLDRNEHLSLSLDYSFFFSLSLAYIDCIWSWKRWHSFVQNW